MSKFSDLEKTIIGLWIILGGIIGSLIAAPIMRQKPLIPGLFGLAFGAGIAYVYFRSPRKRKHKGRVDSSKWIGDKFSDIVLKRIIEVYNIRQEPGLEEETEGEEVEKEAWIDIQYHERPVDLAELVTDFWNSLPITSKVLLYFTLIWPLGFGAMNFLFPGFVQALITPFLIQLVVLLPISLMTAINGLLILFAQNTVDTFEEKPKGFLGSVAAILLLLAGCVTGSYLVWKYMVQLEL